MLVAHIAALLSIPSLRARGTQPVGNINHNNMNINTEGIGRTALLQIIHFNLTRYNGKAPDWGEKLSVLIPLTKRRGS